ncbi:hypothetical protein HN018_15665 [Lichenicola cladoniae]|uniref:Uncharacterized protein n=1 Tax=Lichenicola cladoniae TaxID=1484109 RepID=A0A6M8HSH9_9PROT|nr:hypothetical protein [Lichenicola cladoniae]NPD65683.1 hypothetical protein [Acetobacteraceae bacterium]QKE91290.1 hypothetical protein HN018_15665 [Lichenicola cladoniae]
MNRRRVFEAVLAATVLCGLSIVIVGRSHAPVSDLNRMLRPGVSMSAPPSLVSLGAELHPQNHATGRMAEQAANPPGG